MILKHISRMLCLLISYSKFTRTNSRKRLPFRDKGAIIYTKGTTAPQGGLTSYKDCKDHPFARQSFGVVLLYVKLAIDTLNE